MSKAKQIVEKASKMQAPVPQLSAEDVYWAEVQSRVLARQAEIQATAPSAVDRRAAEFEAAVKQRTQAAVRAMPLVDDDAVTRLRKDKSTVQHSEGIRQKIKRMSLGGERDQDNFWSQRWETHGKPFSFWFGSDEAEA
jgi:hypothetical protein